MTYCHFSATSIGTALAPSPALAPVTFTSLFFSSFLHNTFISVSQTALYTHLHACTSSHRHFTTVLIEFFKIPIILDTKSTKKEFSVPINCSYTPLRSGPSLSQSYNNTTQHVSVIQTWGLQESLGTSAPLPKSHSVLHPGPCKPFIFAALVLATTIRPLLRTALDCISLELCPGLVLISSFILVAFSLSRSARRVLSFLPIVIFSDAGLLSLDSLVTSIVTSTPANTPL